MYITIKRRDEAEVKDITVKITREYGVEWSIQCAFKNDILVSINDGSLIPFKLACNKFANKRLKLDNLYILLSYTTKVGNVIYKSKDFWSRLNIRKLGNKNYLALVVSNTTEAILYDTIKGNEIQMQIEKVELLFDEFNCGAIDMFFSPKKLEKYAK